MRTYFSAGPILLSCLTLISACSSPRPDPGDANGLGEVWVLSQDPLLIIGDEASQATTFERISGVFQHESGRIFVVDGGAGEVRVFGPDGGHQTSWGGKGDGPGEYRRPRLLGRIRGDTMVILDEQDQQISTLSTDGEVGWSQGLMDAADPVPRQALGVVESGQVIVQDVHLFHGEPDEGSVLTDTIHLSLWNPHDRTLSKLGPSASPAWAWVRGEQVPLPFSPQLSVAFMDDDVITLDEDGSRVLVYRRHGTVEIRGSERPLEPVGRAHRAAYQEAVEDRGLPAEFQEAWLAALDLPGVPEAIPAYDKVLATEDGEVWVRHYQVGPTARRWDVFGLTGTLRGFVETPASVSVRQVDTRHVLGVVRDSLGIETVAVFEKHPVLDSALVAAAWDQVRGELSSLVELERIHFADFYRFTSRFDSLHAHPPVEHTEVAITMVYSGKDGFSATASHPALGPGEGCAVFWRDPEILPSEPAVPEVPGEIACSAEDEAGDSNQGRS